MRKAFRISLTDTQRHLLASLLSADAVSKRQTLHARVLLMADRGYEDDVILRELKVSSSTLRRVRKRFLQEGIESVLGNRSLDKLRQRKLDGQAESLLVALAHSNPPHGMRWSLRQLANRMVELGYVDSLSHETVRRTLMGKLAPKPRARICIR